MPAAIVFNFDPWVTIGPLEVRWEAVGLGIALGVALAVFGLTLRRLEPRVPTSDIVFAVLGAIPGAVVGARLVHVLDFADVYAAQPMAALDLGRGSLSLVGAVAGGVLTGSYVVRLLGYRPSRWLDAAAVPLLLGIGLGKLAMLLGGAGLGLASDAPWAVAFGGQGWVSAVADLPSQPAQVYEGLWCLIGAALLSFLVAVAPERWPGSGRRFLAAVCWWLCGRVLIAYTWRDDRVIFGAWGAEQLFTFLLLIVALVTLPFVSRVRARRVTAPA
jgi:prolipoprotein diacylglyceryltransferase